MNTTQIKKDFTIFEKQPDLVYLDSTATSLTPRCVVGKITEYYENYNANIARGVYAMSERATAAFEASRQCTAQFLNANNDEIIFTSGTTMSLNMIARGLTHTLETTQNIVTTAMEHHANYVPWQELSKKLTVKDQKGVHADKDVFRVIDVTEEGLLDMNDLEKKVDHNTAIFALTHVSNVLGTINPIKDIIAHVRKINPSIIVVIDAAQSAPHIKIDVIDLDCDFLAFSAHKMYGPTGVGVLYGKKEQLEKVEPLLTGGEMIDVVSQVKTTYKALPHRLEAGTPNIADVIAFAQAIHYLEETGFNHIRAHEQELTDYALEVLQKNFSTDIVLYGPSNATDRSSVISFTFRNIHPHDIAAILDSEFHIAIRAGQHCAMPLHIETLCIPATARASFGLYNDKNDIDMLVTGLKHVQKVFSK